MIPRCTCSRYCARELRDGLPVPRKRRHQVIRIPDWVPQPVGQLARNMYQNAPKKGHDVTLLHRLTTDSRMKKVWAELVRKKRLHHQTTADFIHPATSDAELWSLEAQSIQTRADVYRNLGGEDNLHHAKRIETNAMIAELADRMTVTSTLARSNLTSQSQALAFLFQTAMKLGQPTPQSVSMLEARKAVRRFRKMAEMVRADANQQQRAGSFQAPQLLEAAFAYDELANRAAEALQDPLLGKRKPRGDSRLKGFVVGLAFATKGIFGAPLYGTVATLANVVLDRRDVTDDKVRKIVKRTPRP
jgi:hypothetical protein